MTVVLERSKGLNPFLDKGNGVKIFYRFNAFYGRSMKLFLFVLLSIQVKNASAWGPDGQTITATIAEKFLSPQAKLQVSRILQGASLASVAIWADKARNTPEWKQSGTWHYVDIDNFRKYTTTSEPTNVMEAITLAEENLLSSSPETQKAVWLKFLIHFLGDIHQPLHVGKTADRGGNSTKVTFKGRSINLHALWDDAFIKERKLSIEQNVNRILSQGRDQSPLHEKFDSQVAVNENLALRNFVYSFSNGNIDSTYASKATEFTDARLWLGGLRLASVLNEIFQ